MAHNIYKDSAMAYAGETPWHGLGKALPANATWAEMKEAAGFYTAIENPVFVPGRSDPLPDVKAITASDDGRYICTLNKTYGVVQADDMAEAIVTAAGGFGAIFHTAGLLGENGARFWLLGEFPEPMRVKGDTSEIRRFFLGTGAHDGRHKATLANVSERVVCANTLGIAMGEQGNARWDIRHTVNAAQRVKDAGGAMARLVKSFARFEALANAMAAARFSDSQMIAALDQIAPIPAPETSPSARTVANATDKRISIMNLASGEGKGISGAILGSAWGAFQAFTEHADHVQTFRQRGTESIRAARMDSIVFGTSASFKVEALNVITSLAGIPMAAMMAA